MHDPRLHSMFRTFLSLLFLLHFSLSKAETIDIIWKKDQISGIISFEQEARIKENGSLPFYCYSKQFNKPIKSFDYSLNVIEVKELSKEEIMYYNPEVSSEKRIEKKKIGIARNEGVASVYFSAIYKNSSQQWIKVTKAEINIINVVFEEVNYAASSSYKNGNSSVLGAGRWYKMAIASSGIYKIDKALLQKMGINPNEVNPKNIRIYGSGGMLNEQVNMQKYFDLPEIAISVYGENDGVFNDGDYILFYAVGPHTWRYDDNHKTYHHQSHYFSDASHYFLTFDLGSGKRISLQAEETGTATDSITTYDDYSFYESDEVNFNKTGRIWYEKALNISSNEKSYSFNFPNADLSSPMELNIEFATRSAQKSGNNVNFTLDNSSIKSFTNINSVSLSSESDYAELSTSWKNNFTPTSSAFNIKMKYSLPLNESECWLNYIEVVAKRNLVLSSSPALFRNISTVKANGITIYKIAGANSNTKIWDVTDPFNVAEQQYKSNGSIASFAQKADTLKEYALFENGTFPSPTFIGQVSNQNIHAAFPVDYVIVAPSDFLSAANLLADYHRNNSGLSVAVVTPDQVYNEFSSGTKDITAIRNMMRYFYGSATSNAELPKYLLLMGDASYDYKNRPGLGGDYVPTFESYEHLSITDSYASDDYFGYLDLSEGTSYNNDKVDIGIGRIPVSSASQATAIIQKIIDYAKSGSPITSEYPSISPTIKSGFGDWRNKIVFIGDDGSDPHQYSDYMEHVNGGESSSNKVKNLDSNLNHQKIYFDAYKKVFTAAGGKYPEVEKSIADVMTNGALIVHYIGHGGEAGWADERVLTIPNINQWSNYNNLPFFVTATCEFSRFDDPQRISGGELAFLNEKGGVMGQLTTSRLVYGNSNLNLTSKFYDSLLANNAITKPTLGTAIMKAKQTAGQGTFNNNRKFYLMGDPAMKLAFPENKIVLSKVNQVAVYSGGDTIKALMKIKVEGEVQDQNNQLLTNYKGILYATIYDKKQNTKTINNINKDSVPYTFQNSIIYKGKATIENGKFTFEFIAPKDINYTYGNGRISLYAANANEDATGYYEGVTIGGTSAAAVSDNVGPQIRLFMNDSTFVFGGLTDENPKIYALIYDETGINITGNAIGHDLVAVLDNVSGKPYILNSSYESDINSYQRGKVQYQLNDLSEGNHQLSLKVWDVNNNSSMANTEFVVAKSAQLALDHVLNYPNPFTTNTQFWFEHNYSTGTLEVQIQIMNINGRVVKTINTTIDGANRYKPEPIPWDGNDDFGDAIGRGVYIYKIKVKADNGMFAEKMEKLVILK